jgi:hypothetical protein
MENNSNVFKSLFDIAKEYITLKLSLIKLKAVDKISGTISAIVSATIMILLLSLFFLFLNLGLAFLIGESLGRISYGFLIIAGFYVLLALLAKWFVNRWLKKRVANSLIKGMMK